MIATSQATTITISIASVLVLLALIATLRVVLRREPTPARWRRFRVGFFVERDGKENDDSQADG